MAEHLKRRGLRSRPTPKVPARPLRLTAIQEMLRNPYYIDVVVYRGVRVAHGRHKPLVDPDTFDRVQALLSARSVAGDRPHKHQHYLRGTLYCAICGGRLLYSKHRGNGGVYEYFCCIGRTSRRQGGRCPSRYYSAHDIEQAIAEHYRTIHVPKRVREAIWADVRRDADERTAIVAKDIERHQRRIKKLTDNQARLVQLSYRGLVTDEVLAAEQQRLEAEKLQAQRLLNAAELQARDIESALDGALATTRTPRSTYLASTSLERRLLNQTFLRASSSARAARSKASSGWLVSSLAAPSQLEPVWSVSIAVSGQRLVLARNYCVVNCKQRPVPRHKGSTRQPGGLRDLSPLMRGTIISEY